MARNLHYTDATHVIECRDVSQLNHELHLLDMNADK